MPRRRKDPAAATAAPTPAPHVIHPRAVYSAAEARAALRLTASTIRREVREGRLKVSKRAGKYFITGEQLWAWITSGEVQKVNAVKNDEPETSCA